jgi:hypothetical protein
MIFYAIQQESTGLFLPNGGKGVRGHTHQIPTDKKPPRLFSRKRDASLALRCWLEGKWTELSTYNYYGEYDVEGPAPRETPNRPKDLKVVSLFMEVIK